MNETLLLIGQSLRRVIAIARLNLYQAPDRLLPIDVRSALEKVMKRLLSVPVVSLMMLLAPTISSAQSQQKPYKVGFIYYGPITGIGWNLQHDMGRQELEKNLGAKVSVRVVPNTPGGPDGERVTRELVADGTQMIFAVGFDYMREVLRVAADNPDRCFSTATAYMTSANSGGYSAKWHEGGYLAGVIAGKTTKSNTIGFVGAFPMPDVMWYLNALTQGARSVNPKATVRAVFVGSWNDPPKETDATNALVNIGADVLTSYTTSPAVVVAADSRDIASISFHSDMRKFAPKHYLTGVTHHWGNYYTKMVTDAMAGKCKGELYFGGVKEGNIRLAPLTDRVPKELADLVEVKTKEIADGKLNVFAGPIKDNKGVLRVKAGNSYPDAELGKMNWYAEGVVVGNQ